MITFWTNCKDDVFRDVIQKTLSHTAKGVEHQRVPYREDTVYYPEKGEVVMVMGAAAHKLMQKSGIIPKNKSMGKMRGVAVPNTIEKKGKLIVKGHWMFSYDPAAPKVDLKKDPEVRWDIRLAERFHRTGKLEPELSDVVYEYVDDFSETIQYIKDKYEFTGKCVDVALDTETMGLIPWLPDKDIVCIQITVEEGQAQVYYMLGAKNKKKVTKQLDWILNTKKASLKGANFKYDLLWIRVKLACTCTNFKFDTLLAGSLINENRSNSLSGHSKEYTTLGGYDAELDRKYDKGHMEKIPKDDLLVYAGGDTDACLRVSRVFRDEFKQNRNLQHFYKEILHPSARVFEDVEHHGMVVDKNQFAVIRKEVVKEERRCIQKLVGMMPRRLRMKHAHRDNLLVPVVLREFLFTPAGLNLKAQMKTPKTGDPTISYDHLMMFLDNPDAKEFISTYKELNSVQKTLNTYIDGFLNHLRPDGRFHPTYALYAGGLYESAKDSGTNTGRTSVIDPAMQTLPKHTKWAKMLRSCYTTPPGYVFFQVDFSQGELRITACHAEEDTMLAAYKRGVDLHAMTGSGLSGYNLDEFLAFESDPKKKHIFDDFRFKAKAANFGLIYGMQAKGYREYARTGFDLELSLKEANQQRDLFFDTYPGLEFWHIRQTQLAHRDKAVLSPLGRVRNLPLIDSRNWGVASKAERQSINAPIQSTLSDLCMWSMVKVRERYTMEEVWLAGMTHDSIYGYIPEGCYNERLAEIKYIMENLPLKDKFQWEPQIPFPVDVEISHTHLGELEKIHV